MPAIYPKIERRGKSLLLCLMLMISPLAGQQELRFDHLGLEDGLSQSSINSIFQDRDGYMWFGTQEGLNRFDGYRFTVYNHDLYDSTSLAGNWVSGILEDADGNLWVANHAEGFNRLNKASGNFTRFPGKTKPNGFPARLIINNSSAFKSDPQGNLWILSDSHLPIMFDPQTTASRAFPGMLDEFTGATKYSGYRMFPGRNRGMWLPARNGNLRYYDPDRAQMIDYTPAAIENFPRGRIYDIFEDIDGIIWIANESDGLTRFDPARGEAATIPIDGMQSHLSNIIEDAGNSDILWISSWNTELIRFNRKDHSSKIYFHKDLRPERYLAGLGCRLLQDAQGNIWIRTAHMDLARFDKKSGKFFRPEVNPRDRYSLGGRFISEVLISRNNILWIGTNGNGLYSYNPAKYKFPHYSLHVAPEDFANANMVFSIAASRGDDDSDLWIGTSGNGFFKYRRSDGSYRNYRSGAHRGNGLPNDVVLAIAEDRDKSIWLGTNYGLSHFFPKTGRFQNYFHRESSLKGLSHNRIKSIIRDSNDNIWIGTDGGLNRFDRRLNRPVRFRGPEYRDLEGPVIFCIYESTRNAGQYLWLGSSAGLLRVDVRNPEKPEVLNLSRLNPALEKLSNLWTLSIYEAPSKGGQHQLWLGTMGAGLARLTFPEDDFENSGITYFTNRHGLSSNVVYGVLNDNAGNIWLSTNRSLTRVNPDLMPSSAEQFSAIPEGFIKNYDANDGLQSGEFNIGAYLRTESGELWFGGINGINGFFPDQIIENESAPPVMLTAFKKLDRKTSFDRPLHLIDEIKLNHNENFFSFEFLALTYTNVDRNRYKYMLSGLDPDWIDNGNRRFVNYTNVPHGSYTFHVKAANSDGLWSNEGASIDIVIAPPFWQTWWFYLMAFSGITLITILIYKLRMNAVRRRVREIEEIKAEEKLKRYGEIEQIKRQEREKVRSRIAADFHDQSGHKLTKISLFCEVLKSQANGGIGEPVLGEYLDRIMLESSELHNDMIDFIWSLDPDEDSLYDTAVKLKDFGEQFFDRTGIAFHVNGISKSLQNVPLNMEMRRNLISIFKEGMNNILKHSGQTCQNVALDVSRHNGQFKIVLSDDGKGFEYGNGANGAGNGSSKDGQNGRQNSTQSRGGNGLKNMVKRSEAISGKVDIISKVGSGTKIEFTGKAE